MKVDRPASRLPQIRVSVLYVDYGGQISRLNRAIDIEADGIEPWECGIGVNGESHDEDCGVDCPNAAYNNLNGPYCKANQVRRLSQQRLDYEWLPSILKFYWQNGVDRDGLAFLRRVVVHSYE